MSEHAEFCKSSAGVTKFPLGRIVHFPCSDHPEDFVYTKLITWISPLPTPRSGGSSWRANRGAITRSFFIGRHEHGCAILCCRLTTSKEGPDLVGAGVRVRYELVSASDSADDYLLHISVLVDM